MADTHTDGSHAQHTNNLDGILRDHQDVPIPLNPTDYRHQAYLGPDCSYSETNDLCERFVFKGGRLLKVEQHETSFIPLLG